MPNFATNTTAAQEPTLGTLQVRLHHAVKRADEVHNMLSAMLDALRGGRPSPVDTNETAKSPGGGLVHGLHGTVGQLESHLNDMQNMSNELLNLIGVRLEASRG